jgi:hypothetical protein
MANIETLEAERARIVEQISALSPEIGRQLPGRKLPSMASAKVEALNRQLAVVNLKIRQAQAR